ncbi:TPA: acyltransferase family protein [Enterobacter hormaechei subsp. steigerwaltii]|nr:acyltransferase family protein [Enterobacter hormaechei subsp. steigerwaltii]HED2277738.1 acyltransferase family protein [Enterobacter hormaechei subsp. steigerwaltii]HED3379572.1 acyltransferase family protein [Enterobacter hormaechei subsp. steigerwaltii]HED3419013.1 acyltransferase family protein [Enterobacter hormaechei subsp. steigerwaltii]HED3561928.1 acyltransferase family protein [Enterobacter hormaechei subsp. steigerwaltii]
MDKQTSLTIDYAKAIGISLVVIGHTAWKPFQTLDPYYFHMPLFFFIGGFLCSGRKPIIKCVQDTFFKYITYTLVTYAIVACIAISIKLSFNAPINVGQPFANNVIDTIKLALERNFHNNLYFLVGWFLLAYAISSLILNCFIKLTLKSNDDNIKTFISITTIWFILIASYLITSNKENYWNQYLNLTIQVLMAFCFMLFGNITRRHKSKFNNVYVAVLSFLIVSIMIANNLYGLPVMAWSMYKPNVFLFFAGALLAIYVVMFTANCIARSCENSKLLLLSAYSKSIMSYHLVFFLFLDAVSYKIFNYNIELATPTKHYYTANSWVFYITLPLMLIPLLAYYFDKAKVFIMVKVLPSTIKRLQNLI